MAITLKAETLGRDVFVTSMSGTPWAVNAYSGDVTAGEVIKAAVSGKNLYLQQVHMQMHSDTTGWLGERLTGSATGTLTTLLGPLYYQDVRPDCHVFDFKEPIKVTAGYDVVIDQGVACSAFAYIEGFTA